MTSKSKTKKFVAVVVSGLVAASMFAAVGVTPAGAATVEELTAQINSLLATIASLQAQIGSAGSGSTSSGTGAGYTFTRSLKQGDTGEDVKQLQKTLNMDTATQVASSGAGSPGNESTYFGPATKAAVVKFQNKYASDILAPVGLSSGTGYVGASTRAKLNSVSGGSMASGSTGTTGTSATPTTPATTGTGTVTTPSGGGLTVRASAQQPAVQLFPLGSARVPFTKVDLTAGSADVTVSGIVVERTGQSVDAIFNGIVALDENGTQIGLEKTLNSQHQTTLTEPFVVKAGQTRTITLAGNRVSANSAGDHAGMVATLSVVGVNTSATVSGSFPITGTAQTANNGLTIGSVTMNRGSLDPGTSLTKEVGITGYTFSSIRITAGSAENIRLRSVRWNQTGSVSTADLANLKTFVDGTSYDVIVSSDGKYYTATFGSGLVIEKGFSKEVSIKGDIVGGSGRTVDFDIAKRTDVNVAGELYGFGVTPPLASSAASADGAAFNNADDYYYDAAQVTVSAGTMNVSVSNKVAAQNIAINTANQNLGAFDVDVKGEAITVGRIGFNITLTSEGANDDVDDITNVTLVDQNGTVVAGPVDGSASDSANTAGSGDGVIIFTDTVTFPVGVNTYSIKGKIGTDIDNNVGILASTTPSSDWATVKGLTTGNTITPSPSSALTGNTMTVKSGALTVSVSSVPIAQTVIAGSKGFEFGRYILDATASGEDIRVTTIPLAFENAGGNRTDLTNCQLHNGTDKTAASLTTGSNVKNPASGDTASSTTLTFDGTGLIVSKGTTKTLSLRCDIASGSTGIYYWGLDSGQQTNYTGATGLASAQTITETLNDSSGQAMTASSGGTLTVALDDNSPSYKIVAAGTAGVELARIRFSATNEDIDIRQIALQLSNGASNTPVNLVNREVKLYDADSGALLGSAVFPTDDNATSSAISNFRVLRDGKKVVVVKGDLATISVSGPLTASGDLLMVDYDGGNVGINGTYGVGVASGSNISGGTTDTAVSGVRIMKTYPVVEYIALSTTERTLNAGTQSNKTLYKFKITAKGGASGDSVGIMKWTFELGSSTLGATTSVYSLYAYNDASFSQPDTNFASLGLINAGNCFNGRSSTAAGPTDVEIYADRTSCNGATTTYKIPSGQTRYFQFLATVASVESGTSNIDSITVRLAGDAAYPSLSTLMARAGFPSAGIDADTNDDFIWTPISTTTSSTIGDLDFTNGYQVDGLPSIGTTQESVQSN